MDAIAEQLLGIMVRALLAVMFLWFLFISSRIFFGFSAKKELKKGNKAVGLFWVGLMILIGLIVAFFPL